MPAKIHVKSIHTGGVELTGFQSAGVDEQVGERSPFGLDEAPAQVEVEVAADGGDQLSKAGAKVARQSPLLPD